MRIIFIFLMAFITSCTTKTETTEIKTKNSNIAILLYDISKSNDTYGILTEEHMGNLYDNIAYSGGGKFYAYHIKSNSLNQEAIEYKIPSADTLAYNGNQYQNENTRKKNQEILKGTEINKAKFIQYVSSKLIMPKSEGYTDIENALKLSKITFDQPNFNNWDKSLIFISDGIHDIRGGLKEDVFESISFPQTKVLLVRTAKHHFLKDCSPILTNSINDAIDNL